MATELKRGDRVEWNFRGTRVVGIVQRKLTSRTRVGGRVAAASPDDPRYVVKSERAGKQAAYRASALKRVR
jgi:hypothetical protein